MPPWVKVYAPYFDFAIVDYRKIARFLLWRSNTDSRNLQIAR